ncbi:MAG: peptide deformylase [Gemmobacter sp.]
MAVLPIVLYPDDRLRAVCAPVGAVDEGVRALAADMLETMYAAPGRGLAAPQVGVLRRLFVMDVAWREGAPDPVVCIDPEIADPSPETVTRSEGCLSIPGRPVDVTRPAAVTLRWTGLDGRRHDRRLTGDAAMAAQHEADHLDGRLIVDGAPPPPVP